MKAVALPSIGQRLLRAVLLSSLLWSLAVSAAVWLTVQLEIGELQDATLRAGAVVMAPALRQTLPFEPSAVEAPPLDPDEDPEDPSDFIWQQVGPDATVVQRSPGAPAQPLAATPTAGLQDVPGWRVYGLALGVQGQMLYVAQPDFERQEAAVEIAGSAALATLAIALLAHLWLRARAERELAPLAELSARLSAHDMLEPGATLGPASRAELQPMHDAIDSLAARLARRMANEQAFSAHAAHALRTPLAGIDTQLAVALRDCPAELQPRLQRARAAAGRLQRVVAALLALFRSGADLQRQPLSLDELLARLPVHGLTLHGGAGIRIDADPDLLSAALLNLLDNALRHGASALHFSLPAPGVLRVQDDGPGVTPARRAELQAALTRQAYEGHTGLGLMLADRVARAHGGSLTLPATERGFAAELNLNPGPA